MGRDVGNAAFHVIAINPDTVFREISIDIAAIELGRNAGSGGAEAQCGTRTQDKNIIQENAIHPSEHQRILIVLLPGEDIRIIGLEGPEMHMFQPADIVTPINLNPAGEDLSAQALDAHAAGIVAPDAAVDGNQIDILKIHRTKAILHAEYVIIIGRRPGGAG